VHCAKIAKDGLLYVCDRGNNRVQVFNGRDPSLGQECRNPSGETGQVRLRERAVRLGPYQRPAGIRPCR